MILESSLRKLYNMIFKGDARKKLYYDLKRSSYIERLIFDKSKRIYHLQIKSLDALVYIRDRPSSDYDVLRQIIFEREYELACSAFEQNFS